MGYFRKNVESLKGYIPGIQPREGGVLKLNTNENPYPPSPRVAEAVCRAACDDLRLYPDPLSTELRERASDVYGLPPGRIVAGNGSDELLAIALRCFVGPGERVAYTYPTYLLYEVLASIQDCEKAVFEVEEDFSLPEAFFRAAARLRFIASPDSPSGLSHPLDRIARCCETTDGVVLVDEAYADFARENTLSLVERFDNLLVTRSFSKSFSMAGVRLGFAFGQERLIEGMMKVKDVYNVNRLSAATGIAALGDFAYVTETVKRIVRTRQSFSLGLEELGFRVFPSDSNFVLVEPPGVPAKRIYEELLKRKILVRYFEAPRLCEYLRISIGTEEQMGRLRNALVEILKAG